MKNYLDGGDIILEALRQLGVDYIISSPGSEWAPLWEAVARQKITNTAGPTYMDVWHEGIAVNMAVGYAQVTGRPQAVTLHAGSGLLQGAMAVHGAQHAEVPLLIMSGESLTYGENPAIEPGTQWYRNLSIVGGPQRLIEPLVKWANQATSSATLYETIIRLGEMTQRPPVGPVYLNVPVETMLEEASLPTHQRVVPRVPKTRATDADIEDVAASLIGSKNPVIVTESAGRDPEAFHALVRISELLGIPVVEGRACAYANFPKRHPLHVGFNIEAVVKQSDLILLVNCRVPWYPPSRRPTPARIISIDDHPLKDYMVYQNLQADLYLEGDVRLSLDLLVSACRGAVDAELIEARCRRWNEMAAAVQADLRNAEARAAASTPINAVHLCACLRETMPADTIYIDETVVHKTVITSHLAWERPQSYFSIHGGGLGQGLGTALGVKLAARQRPMVLLIGDGAFLYNPIVQAFGAAKEYDLPILVVVFNNGKYQAMKNNHLRYYPDGAAVGSDLFHGVMIDGPDYSELGRPFGCDGQTVNRPDRLVPALEHVLRAVQNGRSSILNVVLDA